LTHSQTGKEIFPALQPGSELGWAALAAGPRPFRAADDYYKYVVFKNPEWDFRTLDFDADVPRAEKLDAATINAADPNLKVFFNRGGKLLMYHGWSDPLISPGNSIEYYDSVVRTFGGIDKISNSMRLFMVPGMNHCFGGDGTGTFDRIAPLERWVEQKEPPDQILASHVTGAVVSRTRPLCPYPQVAKYTGAGSTDDASSFVCAKP
jgi:feruloyl esterase